MSRGGSDRPPELTIEQGIGVAEKRACGNKGDRNNDLRLLSTITMRKYKDRHVTGACGCCLVPFIILLIIFVAAVVFTALVWHATIPPNFGWGPMRHHHFDAYRAGFQQGNVIGEQYAARGQPELAGEDLKDFAWGEAERLHVTRDRNQWMKGFRDGFRRGFESFNKHALRQSGSDLTAGAST